MGQNFSPKTRQELGGNVGLWANQNAGQVTHHLVKLPQQGREDEVRSVVERELDGAGRPRSAGMLVRVEAGLLTRPGII